MTGIRGFFKKLCSGIFGFGQAFHEEADGKGKKVLPHEENPPCCRERDTLFDPSRSAAFSPGYSSPCSER